MSERPKREKRLAPQLLAFFETKNPTGIFAGVAASRKQEQDVAEVENATEEKEDCGLKLTFSDTLAKTHKRPSSDS